MAIMHQGTSPATLAASRTDALEFTGPVRRIMSPSTREEGLWSLALGSFLASFFSTH
jgi:hypothetical protein